MKRRPRHPAFPLLALGVVLLVDTAHAGNVEPSAVPPAAVVMDAPAAADDVEALQEPEAPTVEAAPDPGAPRRVREVELTLDLEARARGILHEHACDPFGSEIPFERDGKRYVARIEQHYHPPGGSQRPWGFHRGVSLFVVEANVGAPR